VLSVQIDSVVIVDEQPNVTRIEPSAIHIEAVSKLDQYSIYDFQKRLSAIKRVFPTSDDGRKRAVNRKLCQAKRRVSGDAPGLNIALGYDVQQ
jgi:hypothetical protein